MKQKNLIIKSSKPNFSLALPLVSLVGCGTGAYQDWGCEDEINCSNPKINKFTTTNKQFLVDGGRVTVLYGDKKKVVINYEKGNNNEVLVIPYFGIGTIEQGERNLHIRPYAKEDKYKFEMWQASQDNSLVSINMMSGCSLNLFKFNLTSNGDFIKEYSGEIQIMKIYSENIVIDGKCISRQNFEGSFLSHDNKYYTINNQNLYLSDPRISISTDRQCGSSEYLKIFFSNQFAGIEGELPSF